MIFWQVNFIWLFAPYPNTPSPKVLLGIFVVAENFSDSEIHCSRVLILLGHIFLAFCPDFLGYQRLFIIAWASSRLNFLFSAASFPRATALGFFFFLGISIENYIFYECNCTFCFLRILAIKLIIVSTCIATSRTITYITPSMGYERQQIVYRPLGNLHTLSIAHR